MNLTEFQVDEICRICLNTNQTFINIFVKLENNFSIVNTLMECAPVDVNAEDGLPTQICQSCLQKLQEYFNFKSLIIKSDLAFRQCLQQNEDVKPFINSDGEVVDRRHDELESLSTRKVENVDVVIKEEHESDHGSTEDDNVDHGSHTANLSDNEGNEPLPEKDENDESSEPKKKNDKSENIFKCDHCDKTYSANYRLTFHKRKHNGFKPLLCDFCGKTFAWNSDFSIHIKEHKREFIYQCEFCSKRFVRLHEFKEHRRTHLDERSFKCDGCGKTFKQAASLRSHKKIHSGVKRFQCNICEKAFLTKYVLTKHKRTHTGERPYECIMCNKSFPQDAALFRHNKAVHNINSIKSNNCRIVKDNFKSEITFEASVKKSKKKKS